MIEEHIQHLEIACDESGFSGGNLVGAQSPVFAHASVRIEPEHASELVDSLLRQIGARGSGEYKAAELLRARRRPVLLWLMGPSSPIRGQRVRPPHRHPLLRPCPPASTCSSAGSRCAGSPAQVENPRTRAMAITLYRSG